MDKKTLLELLDTYILKKNAPIKFETPEIVQHGVICYPKDIEAHIALSNLISGINIIFEEIYTLAEEKERYKKVLEVIRDASYKHNEYAITMIKDVLENKK